MRRHFGGGCLLFISFWQIWKGDIHEIAQWNKHFKPDKKHARFVVSAKWDWPWSKCLALHIFHPNLDTFISTHRPALFNLAQQHPLKVPSHSFLVRFCHIFFLANAHTFPLQFAAWQLCTTNAGGGRRKSNYISRRKKCMYAAQDKINNVSWIILLHMCQGTSSIDFQENNCSKRRCKRCKQ